MMSWGYHDFENMLETQNAIVSLGFDENLYVYPLSNAFTPCRLSTILL